MNRIVLIGNGFDLAHGLKTRYEDFINWYWDKRVLELRNTHSNISSDCLCTFKSQHEPWNVIAFSSFGPIGFRTTSDILQDISSSDAFYITYSSFFDKIVTSIETKGWVDIENEYYNLLKYYAANHRDEEAHRLNEELEYLKKLLVEYLTGINSQKTETKDSIIEAIFGQIKQREIAIGVRKLINDNINNLFNNHIKNKDEWEIKLRDYGFGDIDSMKEEIKNGESYFREKNKPQYIPLIYRLPERILLLSFNYTKTAYTYLPQINTIRFRHTYFHGKLSDEKSIIFGYGDEMDSQFRNIQSLTNKEYLKNIKSINYMNSTNYRRVLNFIEYAPFQVSIMGHSCGNSDRTLLNSLFEHRNCISIKPYYYEENGSDNYMELIQNISRSFTDMQQMRNKVVNKSFCEPLVREISNNTKTIDYIKNHLIIN